MTRPEEDSKPDPATPETDDSSLRRRNPTEPINPGLLDRISRRFTRHFRCPKVNLLHLEGVIAPNFGQVGRNRSINADRVSDSIDKAFRGHRLAAVALVINSPGGSPAQSQLIAARIRRRADEHKVPVLAFVEDMAASGGYWLALAADEIYALESSLVGSIGAITASFGFHELIAKIGIERRVQATGPYKDLRDSFRPQRDDEKAHVQDLLDELRDQFAAYVKARRGTRLRLPDATLTSGLVWSGSKAYELGLIDGLADCESLLEKNMAPMSGSGQSSSARDP